MPTDIRITPEQLAKRIAEADEVNDAGKLQRLNFKADPGHYISIKKGLGTSTWFVGKDNIQLIGYNDKFQL
jgi:hypothetical protein